MLDPNPVWTFVSRKPLTQWYGHVHLMPDHVLGQWFCIDRSTGKLKWQRTMFRPNTICGVDMGVIVASEMRSDGPWTFDFGCYGISLENGRLLWASHGAGVWGRLGRLLDFVPCFTNELRDIPERVENGKVFCASGRVLDVQTGNLIARIEKRPKDSIEDGPVLHFVGAEPGLKRSVMEIAVETEEGMPHRRFSIELPGRHIEACHRCVPFVYLLVSDEQRHKAHPTKKQHALPNPTRWSVVVVDLKTGDVVQDFSLDDEKLYECRIEDVDGQGLLIGKSNRNLVYYRRIDTE